MSQWASSNKGSVNRKSNMALSQQVLDVLLRHSSGVREVKEFKKKSFIYAHFLSRGGQIDLHILYECQGSFNKQQLI